MTTPDEFRQFAEECMQAARDAKTDPERKAFLDIAKSWLRNPRDCGQDSDASRTAFR
jgi:hypothetical protein